MKPTEGGTCLRRRSSDEWPGRNPPPSGFRVQLPAADLVGLPLQVETNGTHPVFVGSAVFENSVHPGKIVFSVFPPCCVAYGSDEVRHYGRYELLPITSDMEWVSTKNGEIPPGRRPIEGGHESNGATLYHALGKIDDVDVPGKTGEHLVSGYIISTSLRLAFPLGLCDWNLGRGARKYLMAAAHTPSTSTKSCE